MTAQADKYKERTRYTYRVGCDEIKALLGISEGEFVIDIQSTGGANPDIVLFTELNE